MENSDGEPEDLKNCEEKCQFKITMLKKFEETVPYNIFFNTIHQAPETYNEPNSISFTDLFCPSLGKLKCSLQCTFFLKIKWLFEQLQAVNLSLTPFTILYGNEDEIENVDEFSEICPHIRCEYIGMETGLHHVKLGIHVYEDNSLRVVVSSSNLYSADWNCYNQAIWLSPLCPRLPESSEDNEGDSPTHFKKDLINYLLDYHLPSVEEYIGYVKRADFSQIRVFLVYSVPGTHFPGKPGCHLHMVGELLSQHCSIPSRTASPDSMGPLSWHIIAQASSLGKMGGNPKEYLQNSILRSLASQRRNPLPRRSNVPIDIVFPTKDNVLQGYLGKKSGGCLMYDKDTQQNQIWVKKYFCQWKTAQIGRTEAMPHLKTYCRISKCMTKLAYFLLTSANLSRSAWGTPPGKNSGVFVRSWEMGILFLPIFFNEDFFQIQSISCDENKKLFPFMLHLPLVPYSESDEPFTRN